MKKWVKAPLLLSLSAVMFLTTAGGYASSQGGYTSAASMTQLAAAVPGSSLTAGAPERIPPVLLTGKTELQQGDILSLRLLGVPKDTKPEAATKLGVSNFVPVKGGEWFAAVPIGNDRAPGNYTVSIKAGETSFTVDVKVLAFNFDRQNLSINTSNPTIAEAASPEAYKQFDEKVLPIYDISDDKIYWSGIFARPVNGRITTNFGEIRITNGDQSTARSHKGMDIAAPLGTPVLAPNAGRVVFAEKLLNTGNTVLIEHGGGMKTVYYHMNRLDVSAGDMVDKGTQIGTVGTTGYSTGPHLHYEIRLGDQAVSPQMLFESGDGLYSAATKVPDIRVFVNNQQLNLSQPAFIKNDRLLVPMRPVFESLGASVNWDDASKTVEARRGGLTLRLTVGNTTLRRMDGSVPSDITLDVAPEIVGDGVFVPIRFVAESLNAAAVWDDATKTSLITEE